jgi:carbon monoxide dehydrogenase subunit G
VLLPALLDENDRRCLPGCQSSTKQSEYRLVIEVPE